MVVVLLINGCGSLIYLLVLVLLTGIGFTYWWWFYLLVVV